MSSEIDDYWIYDTESTTSKIKKEFLNTLERIHYGKTKSEKEAEEFVKNVFQAFRQVQKRPKRT